MCQSFEISLAMYDVLLNFQAEKIDIEEKYASLKEEAVGKSKKLKKVWNMLMAAKSEVRLLYLCFPEKLYVHFVLFLGTQMKENIAQ